MENKILAKIETIENDTDVIFFKKIEEFQNELEKLKQEIKELNNDDIKKKLLEFNIEDLENKIKQYFISFKKYLQNKKISDLNNIAGEKNVAEIINFKKAKEDKNKLETNNPNDKIKNKLQEEIQEFQKRKIQ